MNWQNLPKHNLFVVGVALVLSLLSHPFILQRVLQGYSGDYLHNLSIPWRVGLLLLSTTLALSLLNLNLYKTRWLVGKTSSSKRWLALLSDALFITVVYWLILLVVPQLYYLYYLLVFDFLEQQWVTRTIDALSYWKIISLTGRDNSTMHFTGMLYWCLMISSGLVWLFESRRIR